MKFIKPHSINLILVLAFCLFWIPVHAQDEGEEEDVLPVPMEVIVSYEKLAPKFKVEARKDTELEYYPCMECHEDEEPNPVERELEEEHDDILLEHGGGRLWCTTCHHLEQRDYLRSLKNKLIDFDQPYRLCGQCHFQRQKDWFFGGHGKRLGNWKGERTLRLCPACHNPHSPSIKAAVPNPPPELRKGLEFEPTEHHKIKKVWEKYLPESKEPQDEH